jgi:hypothetical protein
MEEINGYSTHLEYISEVFEFKKRLNNIVEYGMGNYSTGLLIDNTDNLISIEMQSTEWYDKMVNDFGDRKNWKHYSLIGPLEFLKLDHPKLIDLAFVDGHGESRPECINFLMDRNCPIIIAHDTEESGYGWGRVYSDNNYKVIVFKKYRNWTTIWTTDDELYKNFIDKKIN